MVVNLSILLRLILLPLWEHDRMPVYSRIGSEPGQ